MSKVISTKKAVKTIKSGVIVSCGGSVRYMNLEETTIAIEDFFRKVRCPKTSP